MTSLTAPVALGPVRPWNTAALPFDRLGIYYFCIVFFVIDSLDLTNVLDLGAISNAAKYGYAAIVLMLMGSYFIRWKTISVAFPPLIFLILFILTGIAFVVNFFVSGEKQSYISAFIAPLVFSVAIFIPRSAVSIDARRIVTVLTYLFSAGAALYFIEAFTKPLDALYNLAILHEVQIHKSLTCVVALCLCILTGRPYLGLCVAFVTMAALILRPLSTLVLALLCCVPIAIALRSRVRTFRQAGVLASYALATMALITAIVVPLLLYFFYDDVAPTISSFEFHLKNDVIGGQSNMDFRLAILKLAFTQIENTSFWYGSALAGSHTVPLSQVPGFGWWWSVMGNAEAAIHSDFVSVFVLMGIIGYFIFSITLCVALADRFRELRRRDLLGSGVVLHSIAIIGLVALVIYCSDQPYLSYYNHAQSVWMLLLFSEVARRSKIV